MNRWLVTGAGGMLGRDLIEVFGARGVEVTGLDRAALDITDPVAATAAVAGHDVVINAAGWTDVDAAESFEGRATAVNGTAVANLAQACTLTGANLLQISTDYVFPGDADVPYAEDAATAPLNAYGRGKLLGEQAALRAGGFVVRTAWLYGSHGGSFAATMLRLAETRETIDVVDDQRGQPTWTRDLAVRLFELGQAASRATAPAGVYHGTASGETSWYGLAREIFRLAGLDPDRIRPTTASRFPRPARRPVYSVLGHAGWQRAGLDPLPPWRDQLRRWADSSGWSAPQG